MSRSCCVPIGGGNCAVKARENRGCLLGPRAAPRMGRLVPALGELSRCAYFFFEASLLRRRNNSTVLCIFDQ